LQTEVSEEQRHEELITEQVAALLGQLLVDLVLL
jgi:hypothetical protein